MKVYPHVAAIGPTQGRGAGMRRTAMLWEPFVSRFKDVFEQYQRRRHSSDLGRSPTQSSLVRWPCTGLRFRRACFGSGAARFNESRRGRARSRRRSLREIPFFLLASNAKLVRDHKALIESIDGQIGDLPPVAV